MNLNKVKEKIKSTRGNRLWIAMGLFCLLFLIFFITVFVLKKNYDGQIEGEKDSYISNEYDQQVKDQNDKEYETLAQYTDESGDKTLALKTSDDGGTYLTLDGEKLPIQELAKLASEQAKEWDSIDSTNTDAQQKVIKKYENLANTFRTVYVDANTSFKYLYTPSGTYSFIEKDLDNIDLTISTSSVGQKLKKISK